MTIFIRIIPLFVPLLLLTWACQEKKQKISDPLPFFKEEKMLSGEILSASKDIKRAISLYYFEDYLFVGDHDSDYLYSLIDMTSDKLKLRFGKVGDGPCEVRFPTSVQKVPGSKNLGLYNMNRFEYLEVNLDSILQRKDYLCSYQSNAAFNVNYQKVIKLDESNFVGLGLFPQRYALSTEKGQNPYLIKYPYFYEEDLQRFKYETLAMAFQGELLVSPNGGRFLATSKYSGNFDIVAYEEGDLTLISRHQYWPTRFSEGLGNVISADLTEDNRFGFLSSKVTEKNIFMLYSGETRSNGGLAGNIVLVYDWQGEPVKKLVLDAQVSLIAVSEDGQTLIGYKDDGQANLIKYRLN